MCKWGTRTKVKLMQPSLQGYTLERHKKNAERLELEIDEELIDSCIAPLVRMLNDYGIRTMSCCCGHGKTANSSIRISAQNVQVLPLGEDLTIHLKFPYKEAK